MVANKPIIKLRQWWISGVHLYGRNVDDGGKYVRSARIKALQSQTRDVTQLKHGDVLETHAVIYELVGLRRRKFSDD